MYLALNGAVHDAAIAAWGLKGHYDSARPISMIRYMGGQGQSSDPSGPSYHPRRAAARAGAGRGGHGRVEPPRASATRTSPTTSARSPSGPGAASRRTPTTQTSGVGWIRAVDWVPVPAQDVRDPGVRRLRLRSQHVQSRGGRGPDRLHRQRVLPGRAVRVDHARRRAAPRGGTDDRTSPSSGRPTTTPPTRPASRGCSWASTSPRTTSRVARPARPAARTPGPWPRSISRARPCPDGASRNPVTTAATPWVLV